jgi:hypothetical protein
MAQHVCEVCGYIQAMAQTGESVVEPMRTRKSVVSWDEILVKGAQLARFPLDKDAPVKLQKILGPAARPARKSQAIRISSTYRLISCRTH